MSCVREDLKAHITDVLVGEASSPLKEEVLTHLETCASCQEDRDQMAKVLGLLKESPPWTVSGGEGGAEDADTLSTIQRQKVESLAARRSPGPVSPTSARKPLDRSASWLALAASLSAVGIALFMARRGGEVPIEAPTPAPVVSSVNQLPQALEAPPLFPDAPAAPAPQSLTTPAMAKESVPLDVPVSLEAMREFERQGQRGAELGKVLDQARESSVSEPAKKNADARFRDEGRAAGGVEGGVVGGVAGGVVAEAPAESRPVATPGAVGNIQASAQPPASAPAASADADEGKREWAESDALQAKRERLQEPTGASQEGKARGFSYTEPPRPDLPAAPPAPPRDMFFESKGANPFIETEEDPQATFGLDVDTASYTLTRNYLTRGLLPPPAAVRVEEFVNAFPNNVLADRGGETGSAFGVRVDGAPNPLHPGYHILRVALKAREVDPRERKAAHLTFVIDVSGSMAAENRLGLVKRSLALLVDKLDERDTIGIVVYGTNGRRILAPTSAGNRDRIMAAIDRLRPEGSTNLQAGLDLGYEMAMESFEKRATNRVVLCTDGVANTGRTEADALLARIRSEAKRGVDMMALGFGMGNYNDALLQRLADEGNGQYAYIDDLGEARAFFLRKLTSVLEVVARDARTQVEFNPARVERYRLLGYEKRDIADRDFRNDAVDAGEINSGHSVTALFEVKLKGGPRDGRIGVARVRYKTGPRSEGVEYSREIVDQAMVRRFDQASSAFRTAFVAARFAEHLRQSYWVKDESLTSLQPLADDLAESTQTNELADLIRKATRLLPPQAREE